MKKHYPKVIESPESLRQYEFEDNTLEVLFEENKQFWFHPGEGITRLQEEPAGGQKELGEAAIAGSELVVLAENRRTYEQVRELIFAGMLILYTFPELEPDDTSLKISSPLEVLFEPKSQGGDFKLFPGKCIMGVLVAERCWRKNEAIFSLKKIKESLKLIKNFYSPESGASTRPKQGEDDKKKRLYKSFLEAWEAMETLGSRIGAEGDEASKRTKKPPGWIAEKPGELKRFLQKLNIKPDEEFEWFDYHSDFTGEKWDLFPGSINLGNLPPSPGNKSISIGKALSFGCYLKNNLQAEEDTEKTSSLFNPIDIFNLQRLTVRILLEHLDIWSEFKSSPGSPG